VIYILLRRVSRKPAKQTFSAVETFAAEIGHFAESLINGTRPVHSAEEDRDVLEVVPVRKHEVGVKFEPALLEAAKNSDDLLSGK